MISGIVLLALLVAIIAIQMWQHESVRRMTLGSASPKPLVVSFFAAVISGFVFVSLIRGHYWWIFWK
jgi:uncharacterized integral membrane protein